MPDTDPRVGPLGQRPPITDKLTNARDIRAALERRFSRGYEAHPDGEGDLTAEIADRAAKALQDGDKAAWELARSAIHEVCGPPRQGVDVQGRMTISVRIVGEDDEEPET